MKLVNLLQLFTSPKFLYASESNHVYVSLLLEAFNNMIQYQYEGYIYFILNVFELSLYCYVMFSGNINLVYAVIRRKELFEKLSNLTLPTAIKVIIHY